MIVIDEPITPDTYNMIFYAADAQRTDPTEKIHVNGPVTLLECHDLLWLPDNMIFGSSLYLINCMNLTELPNCLTVKQDLWLSGTTISHILPFSLRVDFKIIVSEDRLELYKYNNPQFSKQICTGDQFSGSWANSNFMMTSYRSPIITTNISMSGVTYS
jgi:hypothetical protein